MRKNPLLCGIEEVRNRVRGFRKLARDFYFSVVLSGYRCPECDDSLEMAGRNQCGCPQGHLFDPTLSFQRSPCCGEALVRKTLHYACSGCGRVVRSLFLFDEKLFDSAYFRERMRQFRRRAEKKREEMRDRMAESRSGALILTEEPLIETIPGLIQALDDFLDLGEEGGADLEYGFRSEFRMSDYRGHILSLLEDDCLLFSDISPVVEDSRKDRIWRFVTLVFMDNEREVMLTQYGDNLLVERYRNEAYR